MIDDAKIAQMRKACNGSRNKPWAGMMHDLLDEIEHLRAKCEERKKLLARHDACIEFEDGPNGMMRSLCASCKRDRDHEDDCAWKRAMEDV